ncbi:MAG TPA: M3 family oligoendopeptidase [Longilinea sp.]|nr:M3 family oligoendopeptidase [Longilinea sp.]
MKPTPYTQRRWSLNDLFAAPDSPEIKKAFKSIEKNVKALEALRPKLTGAISSNDFMDLIRQLEKIERLAYRAEGYAGLLFAEDTQNQQALSLMARVDQFMAQMSNRVLFFSLWWKSVSDETADRLMADSGDYRYWLEEIRHFKPHTLSEAEEKIVNIKNVTGSSAMSTLYDTITNRYVFNVKVGNKVRELTRGELMTHARGSDPELRERAYQELYRVYGNDGPILGQMYQNLTRDWRNENMDLRHFKSPIAARNLVNDIPDAVVDTLLDVCQKNTGVFQRFFLLKAKWLGMKRLRRYDIYAPVAKSGKRYTFEKATGLVFESFDQFDPRFAALAEQVLKEDHLDSEVRKGKRDGAFCSTLGPDLTPWVLTNFQGKADDVATLAHELGHAIHSQMASHHSLFTQHACLPLAETASTFGEMMLVDKLLKEEKDEAVRRDLLFRQMDDAYATIQRQAFFALFERQAHDMVQNGASVDDLAAAYLENLKSQFGDAVEVSDEFKWEWVSIPHIYNVPFYVYAYAFGQLLVFSLYRQFKKEGDAFKPRYKKILATGGSQAPAALLKDAGIDIRKAAFWQGGFDVVSELVSQLEAIPVKK